MSSTKSFGPERFHRHAFAWFDPPDALCMDVRNDNVILRDWLGQGRPLIIRRPCLSSDGKNVCLGLALPPAPDKQRLSFDLPLSLVREVSEPPLWEECAAVENATLEQIRTAANEGGVRLRTFGSHAWQHLTGLPYLTTDSDLDLLLFIETRKSWAAIRKKLEQIPGSIPSRIDLEIVLGGDASFSWREFSTTPQRLLFKGNSRVWLGNTNDVTKCLRE